MSSNSKPLQLPAAAIDFFVIQLSPPRLPTVVIQSGALWLYHTYRPNFPIKYVTPSSTPSAAKNIFRAWGFTDNLTMAVAFRFYTFGVSHQVMNGTWRWVKREKECVHGWVAVVFKVCSALCFVAGSHHTVSSFCVYCQGSGNWISWRVAHRLQHTSPTNWYTTLAHIKLTFYVIVVAQIYMFLKETYTYMPKLIYLWRMLPWLDEQSLNFSPCIDLNIIQPSSYGCQTINGISIKQLVNHNIASVEGTHLFIGETNVQW